MKPWYRKSPIWGRSVLSSAITESKDEDQNTTCRSCPPEGCRLLPDTDSFYGTGARGLKDASGTSEESIQLP